MGVTLYRNNNDCQQLSDAQKSSDAQNIWFLLVYFTNGVHLDPIRERKVMYNTTVFIFLYYNKWINSFCNPKEHTRSVKHGETR